MNKASLATTVVAVLSVALAGLALLSSYQDPPVQQVARQSTVMTITETRMKKAEWSEMILASGGIFAWHEAVVSAQLSGLQLVKVDAEEGDNVQKGQHLAKLETRLLSAEYAELMANWISAEADRKRALRLKKTGSISEKSIDDAENLATVAKAKLDAKSVQLDYADIVAPDDGTITSRSAALGAVVNAGDELFRITRQDKLEWHAELTANQARNVQPGQSVLLSAPDGTTTRGTVRRLAPVYNVQNRLIPVFVELEKTAALRPGMYAEGQILLGRSQEMTLPTKSIIIRDGYSYVFKIIEQGGITSVRQIRVEPGKINGQRMAVRSELDETDRIVLQGAGFLNDGDHVRIVHQERTSE